MSNTKDLNAVTEYVSDILRHCGIPPNLIGAQFLAEAVAHKIFDNTRYTNAVFTTIAEKHKIDVNIIPRKIAEIVRTYSKELFVYLDINQDRMDPIYLVPSRALYVKSNYFFDSAFISDKIAVQNND
ncbi:MAG: hypothetical protein K2L54_02705 [Clostridiales bacterium]|nr:hypothetical protein [Clostridiales bacterium]